MRREEYDAGVARLNQRLSDDLNDAAIRLQQQQNIKNQDLAAFESLRASVSALPSVMSSSLGIGANLSDSGTAFAMRVLKSKGARCHYSRSAARGLY